MKVSELKQMIESIVNDEVKNTIINEANEGNKEVYHIKCDGVPLASFDTEAEAKENLPKYQAKNKGELIIEKGDYDSHEDMLDKLDEMNDQLEETKETEMNEMLDTNEDPYEDMDSVVSELKEKTHRLLKKGKITEDELYEIENIIDNNIEEYWDFSRNGSDVKNMFAHIVNDVAPHLVKKKEKNHMENTQPMEGNEFSGALKAAKDAGEEKFTVDGKEYDVEECWGKQMEEELHGNQDKIDADKDGEITANDFKLLSKDKKEEPKEGKKFTQLLKKSIEENQPEECDECGGMATEEEPQVNESKKKTLRLTESELVNLITKMVNESVPGLTASNKAHKESGAQNAQALKDSDKKMKDYLSIPGNNNNEFPNQNKEGDKVAVNNTEEEDEFVQDNRGGTMLNLDYDQEPSDKFKDRLKKALEGDVTMGNSQDAANTIKSDLGKNLSKQAERKAKKEDEAPMYNKDAQPMKTVKESKVSFSNVLNEEIEKMKKLTNYDEKTQ